MLPTPGVVTNVSPLECRSSQARPAQKPLPQSGSTLSFSACKCSGVSSRSREGQATGQARPGEEPQGPQPCVLRRCLGLCLAGLTSPAATASMCLALKNFWRMAFSSCRQRVHACMHASMDACAYALCAHTHLHTHSPLSHSTVQRTACGPHCHAQQQHLLLHGQKHLHA